MSGLTLNMRRTGAGKWDALMKLAQRNAAETSKDIADDVVKDVQGHWSGNYPPASSPGEPPAVRTGYLDASVMKEKDTGLLSVFRPKWLVVAKAPYASFLEYGTARMAARPFMRPAMIRMSKNFGKRWKGLFR